MLNNQKTLHLQSRITDDWGSSHRVAVDLKALATANNWEIELDLPNGYEINQIYGAKLNTRAGKTYISGQNWNKNLAKGKSTEIVLLVEEGNKAHLSPILPQFILPNDSSNTPNDDLSNSNSSFDVKSRITDDWGGSHRVAIDLKALTTANNWEIEVDVPNGYTVDQIYGAKLNNKGGKTYISGSGWNKNLAQGKSTEVVLIVKEGNKAHLSPILPQFILPNGSGNTPNDDLDNSDSSVNFDVKSRITDDWGGRHRVAVDLKALTTANNWEIELDLPNGYQVDQIYRAKLNTRGGKTYISGSGWNKNLAQGKSTEVVLIIEEGNKAHLSPILPQFILPNGSGNTPNDDLDNSDSSANLDLKSRITDDWGSSHRVAVDVKALTAANDWEIEVDLSSGYHINQIYGAELNTRGGKNYISGKNWNENLAQGQSTEVVLIVEEGNKAYLSPILPQLTLANGTTYNILEDIVDDNIGTDRPKPNKAFGRGRNIIARPESGGKIINVDRDFNGNLNNAIASAQNGDVVRLGKRVYYTDGITLSKDITIDGVNGSVINGKGTSEAIFTLRSEARGATIQDVEITNGSIGIYGYKVFDLTLQNLDINNIGINNTNRNGQYNTGIVLNGADGLQLLNSSFSNLGRKGIGVNGTDGATISGISVTNVNLKAQHSQSHDAAGIKFFNTNDILLKDSYFSDINANMIWPDTTRATSIVGNVIENVGEDFLKPSFNSNVHMTGIYNEKSPYSVIKNNYGTANNGFVALKATEFSTATMVMENNNFSSYEINTQDYWVNESIEKRIALTEDPDEADFSLFADEYFAQLI